MDLSEKEGENMANTEKSKSAAVDYGVKTTTSGGVIQIEKEDVADRKEVLAKKAEVMTNGK